MRVFIYRRAPSAGAVALATALRGMGIESFKRRTVPRRQRGDDAMVAWGDNPIGIRGWSGRTLNAADPISKLSEVIALRAHGVPTVDAVVERGLTDGLWLPRSNYHRGGYDLLNPPVRQDFWVRKEEIVKEYRVHVFEGQSIRAGFKVPRIESPHPWIRSYQAGWKLDYGVARENGFRDKHRSVAKDAIQALGLQFGAVDVAERDDGSVFVLEVNRAPGLEGATVTAYAERIKQWAVNGGPIE